jgi:hypothetical protein
MFLCNLAQFSLIKNNPKQLIMEKMYSLLNLGHHMPTTEHVQTFQSVIFFPAKELLEFYPEGNKSKSSRVCNAHGENRDIYYSRPETKSLAYAQFCNQCNPNILLMWAVRYLKNTFQPKFGNNIELARVLAEN